MLSLVANIYEKTKCSVKGEGNKVTQFFNFTKGVRQGCPLSPLLFNLYINQIFEDIDNVPTIPIRLQNSEDNINGLMYADDLVILAESETTLQSCVKAVSKFCDKWKLSINTKKTKCMVFNRGNRLCKSKIYIKDYLIENVKTFKYLGFTIGAKNFNLSGTPQDLSIKARKAIFALNNKIKLSRLPPSLALKLFYAQISPILLYGAEIWGAYGGYNFTNWENSTTERAHTQFLKRILGCDIHSPNLMVRAEVGKRPLLVDIISRSTSYIKHVGFNAGSLAYTALDNELSEHDDSNILSLSQKFTPYFNDDSNYKIPSNKIETKKVVTSYYEAIWKEDLNAMSKADTYRSIKSFIFFEKYLSVVKNHKHRIALSRLRLTSHQLMIEKGRHQKPALPRTERKCPFCKNCIENECHFITTCPLYNLARINLLKSAQKNSSSFKDIPTDDQKFIFMLSNEDPVFLNELALFTYNAFKSRSNYMGNLQQVRHIPN